MNLSKDIQLPIHIIIDDTDHHMFMKIPPVIGSTTRDENFKSIRFFSFFFDN